MQKDLFGVCPFSTAQKILSGKWTLMILYLLSRKTMRFNELQKELANITQATLTKQLRTMEGNGLIVRKVYSQVPPKVEYSLNVFLSIKKCSEYKSKSVALNIDNRLRKIKS